MALDGVEVGCLVLPELYFCERSWVVPLFESLLWFELKYIFDLLRPCDDGTLKDMSLILIGGGVTGGEFM